MTEQTETVTPPPPSAPPASAVPARQRTTLAIPVVIGIAVATFVLGGLLGSLVGGVVGYAIHDDHGPDFERSRMMPPGDGSQQFPAPPSRPDQSGG
jgi:hypothetical protein